MERHVVFVLLLSVAVLTVLNHHAGFGWSTSSAPSLSSYEASSSSFGMEDLHRAVADGGLRRQLLQVLAPAPAPGPDQAVSGSTVFIAYGALTASFVPCPPQTGRSYYTPNCASATGAVSPYTRGCSAITRCARDSS